MMSFSSFLKNRFYKKTVFIDGSNVLLSRGFISQNFETLLTHLQVCEPEQIICIADASLPHRRDVKKYIDAGQIMLAPAGSQADVFLLQLAQSVPNAVIISNDGFRDFDPQILAGLDFARFLCFKNEVFFDLDLKKKRAPVLAKAAFSPSIISKKSAPPRLLPPLAQIPVSVSHIKIQPQPQPIKAEAPAAAAFNDPTEAILGKIFDKKGQLSQYT